MTFDELWTKLKKEDKKGIFEKAEKMADEAILREPIPCRVTQMSSIYWGNVRPYDLPEFTIEACPKNSLQAQMLQDLVIKGEVVNLSFEHHELFPELAPTRIVHSGPCTIVFWNDGTKTIVRCSENDTYDEYAAFCSALAKKLYGTNSGLKKMLKTVTVEQKKKEPKPAREETND